MQPHEPIVPPQLAPPGAGLPKLEQFFARVMVRWMARRTDRPTATAIFARERDAILHLLEGASPEKLSTRVLIKRLPGLEDSSRYWSALMTVDHLRIVNAEITTVIASLGNGKSPSRVVSTAAVKPSETVDRSVIAAFEQVCRDFEQMVAGQANLQTEAVYAHPWFGDLNAAGWHFMTGFHMDLHRKQIERIFAAL
jgi:hypothetical protein